MAVPTGTTWDLVLDQTATRTDAVTTASLSPRAAYQAALHGRAILVDVRPTRHPDRAWVPEGRVFTGIRTALARLREESPAPVLLLDADGAAGGVAATVAAAQPRSVVVDGGFEAWRRDGLPTVRLEVVDEG